MRTSYTPLSPFTGLPMEIPSKSLSKVQCGNTSQKKRDNLSEKSSVSKEKTESKSVANSSVGEPETGENRSDYSIEKVKGSSTNKNSNTETKKNGKKSVIAPASSSFVKHEKRSSLEETVFQTEKKAKIPEFNSKIKQPHPKEDRKNTFEKKEAIEDSLEIKSCFSYNNESVDKNFDRTELSFKSFDSNTVDTREKNGNQKISNKKKASPSAFNDVKGKSKKNKFEALSTDKDGEEEEFDGSDNFSDLRNFKVIESSLKEEPILDKDFKTVKPIKDPKLQENILLPYKEQCIDSDRCVNLFIKFNCKKYHGEDKIKWAKENYEKSKEKKRCKFAYPKVCPDVENCTMLHTYEEYRTAKNKK